MGVGDRFRAHGKAGDADVKKPRQPICTGDCFHCPFPDCVNDSMTIQDYRAEAKLDRELREEIRGSRQRERDPYFAEYRAQNREAIAARHRNYYAANRNRIAAYKRDWYAANRDRVRAEQDAYREAARFRTDQAAAQALRGCRKAAGLSQMQLAALVRLAHVTISRYETGASPFKPEIFREALPELEQTINRLRGIP